MQETTVMQQLHGSRKICDFATGSQNPPPQHILPSDIMMIKPDDFE